MSRLLVDTRALLWWLDELGKPTAPPHHRDPFDRLIVAQALQEQIPVVTRDPQFGAYGVRVIS